MQGIYLITLRHLQRNRPVLFGNGCRVRHPSFSLDGALCGLCKHSRLQRSCVYVSHRPREGVVKSWSPHYKNEPLEVDIALYWSLFCLYPFTLTVSLVIWVLFFNYGHCPWRPAEGSRTPLSCSGGWLWATRWGRLGIKYESFARAVCVHNYWAISPVIVLPL